MKKYLKKDIKLNLEKKIESIFGKKTEDASPKQIFKALSYVVNDMLVENRVEFKKKRIEQESKQIYYMSMEFLLGRSLKNHMFNLGVSETVKSILNEYKLDIDELLEIEPDAGLGNGGLGRLAAAYMESLTNLNYCATGFSIRYDYGIFKQRIVDGWQVEMPDNWLDDGSVWLSLREEDSFEINFGGTINQRWENDRMYIDYVNSNKVMAVPYDMNISGYKTKAVNKLRLWQSRAPQDFDIHLFSKGEYVKATESKALAESISKVLYPADDHFEGKSLRLKQQYFFVSASIQSIIKKHIRDYGDLNMLPDKVAIHINDTHPALCVPELMRILLDEYGFNWESAWAIVARTMSYTNHTVLAEALEKWPEHLFKSLLPRIHQIVEEINRRFCNDLWNFYPNDWEKVANNAILSHNQVKMANLCLSASHSVNGVSALHSEILKNDVFNDYFKIYPSKFTNVTNGITYRRWLAEANPLLTNYLKEVIGDDFLIDSYQLKKLEMFKGDKQVLDNLEKIKRQNKVRLSNYIKQNNGITVNPDSIFDVQVKRLHEYKRQLLNCLNILDLYYQLKANPNLDINPRTFIFGAKSAPSYYVAKQIIRLINMLGEMINNDKSINDKIKVIFLENYRVSLAEIVMPASEVSEQISVAGKEASGTGNMKFMINGAVTIGTMDGANIEIFENVGDENIFIFGMLANEIESLYKNGYESSKYYNSNMRIKNVIDGLHNINGVNFGEIADNLLIGKGGMADSYMLLADFQSYVDAQTRLDKAYSDKERFNRMSLMNIANSGFFSSDRAIKEYADKIWDLTPIKI